MKTICKNCKEDKNLHSFPLQHCPGVNGTTFQECESLIYQEANLEEVVRYYAKDFSPAPSAVEFFIDVQKNKVIFKLYQIEGDKS